MTSTQAVEKRISKWIEYAEKRGLVVEKFEDTGTIEFRPKGDDTYSTKIWIHTFDGIVRVNRYYPYSATRVPVPQKQVFLNINVVADCG
jgi:hypothetical protein